MKKKPKGFKAFDELARKLARVPAVEAGAFGEQIIEQLLDAAFAELQHDTGPQDVEWHHQRKVLTERFREILSMKN